MEKDTESLLDRVRALEERLESGDFVSSGSRPLGEEKQEEIKPAELTRALSEDIKEVVGKWNRVIAEVANPGQSMLKKCKLTVTDDDRLLIATFDATHYDYLTRDKTREEISGAMQEVIGKTVVYDIMCMEEKNEFKKNYPDLSVINMEIEIEE